MTAHIEGYAPTQDRLGAGARELGGLILSDFDYTLCDRYVFDPTTNDHTPHISPQLIEAAQGHHIVVATGRRANHPAMPQLWRSGLIDLASPVVAENGGTLVYAYGNTTRFVDLVDDADRDKIHGSRQTIEQALGSLPSGQEIVYKLGRTMLIARLQARGEGGIDPARQAWLAEKIQEILAPSMLNVVDTRASVTIQHPAINKRTGFRRYLERSGIDRADIYVIGMGDALNDREIFDEADLRIGFSSIVRSMVDIEVPGGAGAAPTVLHMLRGYRRARTLRRSA